MNDFEFGKQHGKLGFEARYPNNPNYMRGFAIGSAYLLRQCELDRPFESMLPYGINEAMDTWN